MTEKEKELYDERLKKLEGLKKDGIDPYPASTKRKHRIVDLLEDFAKLEKGKKKHTIAGRVRAIRGHGAIMFGTLDDGSGTIQFILKKDETPPASAKATGGQAHLIEWFNKFIDIGDFVELSGSFMTTQRGEKSMLVAELK